MKKPNRQAAVPASIQRAAEARDRVEPRGLGVRDAAQYLSTTKWFMRQLARSREIPFQILGKRMIFDKRDLDAFLEKGKQAMAK